ncbi:pilus assembly protein [Rhodopseudomonas sp. HC1]|uniref:TadE/TadG family type IV pilus assembly protein n=1 Tax=Rhodopseudomonas infernalis TaxID=2897386 RepID=UPI001EE890EB|nr:TadE/TadG family type IV pilus assembly protein [Rhodopseudomonas infernalis]MCG6203051.1 pilus assembly protein [Rhodopseudomonas infernalis]
MARSSSDRSFRRFAVDACGIAAVEFAMALPIMLVLLFGVIEVTSGFVAKRRLTMATRTFSDLVSRGDSIDDAGLKVIFAIGGQVMSPQAIDPLKATISQIKVAKDANNKITTTIHWSRAVIFDSSGKESLAASSLKDGDSVTVPDALQVAPHYPFYLVKSETTYKYVPMFGYVMAKAGIDLTNEAYTKPRQTNVRDCVQYGTATC